MLGLPLSFEVDEAALQAAFFNLQRAHHPDRQSGKTPADRQRNLLQSADINVAYATLKDPLRRAQYLLGLKGLNVVKEGSVAASPSVLQEALEWRERILSGELIEKLNVELNALVEQLTESLGTLFEKEDFSAMAQETLRLGYAIKARQEIAALARRRKTTA